MPFEEGLTGYDRRYLKAKNCIWPAVAAYVAVRGLGLNVVRTKWGTYKVTNRYTLVNLFPWYERQIKRIVWSLDGGLFVDVGANVGLYTVMAAKRGCEVMAFEPGDTAFAVLLDNVHRNGVWSRVHPYRMAAWGSDGDLFLAQAKNTGMRKIAQAGDRVQGIRLDEVIKRKPVLIKVDVEDSEPEVFKGMERVLSEWHPDLIFESQVVTEGHLAKCLSLLKPHGYGFRRLDPFNWLATFQSTPS